MAELEERLHAAENRELGPFQRPRAAAYASAPTSDPIASTMEVVAPAGVAKPVKEYGMNDKRTRGNKEVKKPKQAPRVTPPPAGGANAPTAQAAWPRPQQAKK